MVLLFFCYLLFPLWALRFTGLVFYSWTFFWLVTGYSQVRPRHQLADCSDHILLVQDPARRGGLAEKDPTRGSALRLNHSGTHISPHYRASST